MTADTVNSWANGFLIASLIVGVVATYAIVVSGNIKESKLKVELSKATAEVEKAKNDAANANERAAKAKLEVEYEKFERLKLEEKISPRRLTKDMKILLSDSLSQFRSCKIIVNSYSGDIESTLLGIQIIESFKLSGIEVVANLSSETSFSIPIIGISITGKNKLLIDSLLKNISTICLLDVNQSNRPKGYYFVMGNIDESQTDAIVFIGAKPIKY